VTRTRSRRAAPFEGQLHPDEVLAARRRARDRSLRRDAVLLLAVVVGLAITWSVRLVPDEEHPAGVAASERMEETYRVVRAGDLEVGTEVQQLAPGIDGVRLERESGDRWVITSEVGSRCYSMWWDEEGVRRVRTVPATLACSPTSELTSARTTTFDRVGQATGEEEPTASWERVLPDPLRHRMWFLPALIVGGGLGLSALVRMSIALLTGNDPAATRR
jgi:hypothetical protein